MSRRAFLLFYLLVSLLFVVVTACLPLADVTTTPSPSDTPSSSDTSTEVSTSSASPSLNASPTSSATPTASRTATPTEEPTATREVLPIVVTDERQLVACAQQQGATCDIVGTIYLTSQLTIFQDNVTLRGGSITNVPGYSSRLLAIIGANNVRLEGVMAYGTLATQTSCCKDILLISSSTAILDHVTLLYGEDENLDIQNNSVVTLTNSVIMQPLDCAMHSKGCHGYDMLVTDSTVTIRDSVICCASARMPEIQNSTVIMERVLLDDLDGAAISVQCDGILFISESRIRGGFDTDVVSYGIVTPHAEDCAPAGFAPPQITEKCTLVVNWHVDSTGTKYPRVRRSSTYYTNPITTTEFKSDASGCTMPSDNPDDIATFIQNAGSPLTPACIRDATC